MDIYNAKFVTAHWSIKQDSLLVQNIQAQIDTHTCAVWDTLRGLLTHLFLIGLANMTEIPLINSFLNGA